MAETLGVPACTIDGTRPIAGELEKIYTQPGPVFVNVEINPNQKLYPVVKFGSALEDQLPALGDERLKAEMIVPPFTPSSPARAVRQASEQGW